MQNVPTVFNFDTNTSIRTISINDDPHFVVKDICSALDLTNPRQAISDLKSNYESIQIDPKGVISTYPLQTPGGVQESTVVTETGLYDLIMQSRKPSALKFKHWISSEVLPAIRKTGKYDAKGKPTKKNPSRSKIAMDLAANVRIAKIFGLEGNQALLSANMMTSKAYEDFGVNPLLESGVELVAADKVQYWTPTQLGKKISTTAIKINKALEAAGLQVETRDQKGTLVWQITDKGKPLCQMLDTNKKHSDGTPVLQVKWSTDVLEHCPMN